LGSSRLVFAFVSIQSHYFQVWFAEAQFLQPLKFFANARIVLQIVRDKLSDSPLGYLMGVGAMMSFTEISKYPLKFRS